MQKDLTKGNPYKVILLFALPMLVSMLFQQMYNIADSVVVGKFVGEDALAAVGASYPVTMIFLGFATGAGIGCSVVISQVFGAKDMRKLKTTICTAMLGILGLCVVVTLIGIFTSGALLRLLKTPDNIFADSKTYLDVYIFGLFFLFMYNAATSVFQALGNSRLPLFLLIFSSLFNIVLDVVFVYNFKMGVAGVAWATFIAQGISCVLANVCLLVQVARIKGEGFRLFDFSIFKTCAVVAVPSILQSTIVSVGQLLVQGLINSYGSTVIAGYSAAIKVNTSIIMILMTVANAVSSYTAQNCGAGNLERIRQGFKVGIVLSYAVAIVCAACVGIWADQLIGLFIDAEGAGVIEVGRSFLLILIPGYFLVNLKTVSDSVMRGCGDMVAFMISTLIDLILRVGLSYLLAFLMGSYLGIWWAYPIGWLVGMVVSLLLYRHGKWKCAVLENAAHTANGASAE